MTKASLTMDGGLGRAIEAAAGLSPPAYRDAMAHVAGHVHVVTTAGPTGTSGFTAIAVASVSDNPPTLLVCLNRASANGPLIAQNGAFAINALPAGAEALAEAFAGRSGLTGAARFRQGIWTRLSTGSPVLESALASFDCRLIDMREVATHYVVMGEVEAVRIGPAGAALTYFDRAYRPLPR
jgi:flavin reductase (DIM6/NTAB) family NADH-FMN oxidoreductase RutF